MAVEILFSLLIGIGLSATSGFRIFVPFLVLSIVSLTGHVKLAPGFDWIGTYPALIAFAVATILEILAYFFPYVDNLLSAAGVPAAVIAGTVLSAAVFFEMGPLATWAVAIIAGGGSALASKTASTAAHTGSPTTTGGTANPVLSAIESLISTFLAVLSVLVPILAVLLIALAIYGAVRFYRRVKGRRSKLKAG